MSSTLKCTLVGIGMAFATVAISQPICSDLDIISVTYAPFSDTAVQVVVNNNGSDIYAYPGFILFDQNGDTLAKEVVNTFGIGAPSVHLLNFHPNANIPTGQFTATLELWTGFYQLFACTWNMTVDLCPADTCTNVTVNIGNFGSALINSSFDWMITDTLSNTLASGTFFMADTIQSDLDNVCLPPGEYLYWVDSPQPTGGQPYFGISAGLSNYGIPLIQGGGNQSIPFTLFGACTDFSQNVLDQIEDRNRLNISSQNGTIFLSQNEGKQIGVVEVFDLHGRMLFSQDIKRNIANIDLREYPTGVYLLRSKGSNRTQRFLLK